MFTYLNSVIILYPVINLCQPTPAVMLMNQKHSRIWYIHKLLYQELMSIRCGYSTINCCDAAKIY